MTLSLICLQYFKLNLCRWSRGDLAAAPSSIFHCVLAFSFSFSKKVAAFSKNGSAPRCNSPLCQPDRCQRRYCYWSNLKHVCGVKITPAVEQSLFDSDGHWTGSSLKFWHLKKQWLLTTDLSQVWCNTNSMWYQHRLLGGHCIAWIWAEISCFCHKNLIFCSVENQILYQMKAFCTHFQILLTTLTVYREPEFDIQHR